MLCRRHAHVSKPSLYSTIRAPTHKRVHNGLVPGPRPLTVLIPCSHCVPPRVPTWRKVLSMSKAFAGSRRVSPAVNGPSTCSPIAQRPAVCPHRIPPSAHSRLSRHHVTATQVLVITVQSVVSVITASDRRRLPRPKSSL